MYKGIVFMLAVLLLGGCAGSKIAVPAPFTVVIVADQDLNPDRNGQPMPVQVKLLRLRSDTAFNSGDFFTLYEKEEQLLGTELVGREILMVQPGETRTMTGKSNGQERMLGVVVAYRELENGIWRGLAPLPAPKPPGRFSVFSPSSRAAYITIRLGANKVEVTSNIADTPADAPARETPRLPSLPSMPTIPSVPSIPSLPTRPGHLINPVR